jgi:hypothetical protein
MIYHVWVLYFQLDITILVLSSSPGLGFKKSAGPHGLMGVTFLF